MEYLPTATYTTYRPIQRQPPQWQAQYLPQSIHIQWPLPLLYRGKNGIDKMQLIVIELAKFKHSAHELTNELEELLFTMANAHTIDLSQPLTIPPFWKKEWLQDVIKELNLSSMSAQNRALFNISVARVMAINDEFEREQKKAKKAGANEANRISVEKLLKRGKMTVEEIAEDIGVSTKFVLQIQAKMSKS